MNFFLPTLQTITPLSLPSQRLRKQFNVYVLISVKQCKKNLFRCESPPLNLFVLLSHYTSAFNQGCVCVEVSTMDANELYRWAHLAAKGDVDKCTAL